MMIIYFIIIFIILDRWHCQQTDAPNQLMERVPNMISKQPAKRRMVHHPKKELGTRFCNNRRSGRGDRRGPRRRARPITRGIELRDNNENPHLVAAPFGIIMTNAAKWPLHLEPSCSFPARNDNDNKNPCESCPTG